jgi:hypothetical protein
VVFYNSRKVLILNILIILFCLVLESLLIERILSPNIDRYCLEFGLILHIFINHSNLNTLWASVSSCASWVIDRMRSRILYILHRTQLYRSPTPATYFFFSLILLTPPAAGDSLFSCQGCSYTRPGPATSMSLGVFIPYFSPDSLLAKLFLWNWAWMAINSSYLSKLISLFSLETVDFSQASHTVQTQV